MTGTSGIFTLGNPAGRPHNGRRQAASAQACQNQAGGTDLASYRLPYGECRFSQVGMKASLIPTNIVSSAFISLWMEGNPDQVKRIADFIVDCAIEAQAEKQNA